MTEPTTTTETITKVIHLRVSRGYCPPLQQLRIMDRDDNEEENGKKPSSLTDEQWTDFCNRIDQAFSQSILFLFLYLVFITIGLEVAWAYFFIASFFLKDDGIEMTYMYIAIALIVASFIIPYAIDFVVNKRLLRKVRPVCDEYRQQWSPWCMDLSVEYISGWCDKEKYEIKIVEQSTAPCGEP